MSFTTDLVWTRYGKMHLPSDDRVIARSLRIYGEWAEHEIATVSGYLHDGQVIVDIGANIGVHTLAFARRFPNSTIVAIEPHPFAYTLLANNVAENALPNVQAEHCACGQEAGTVSIPRTIVRHGGEPNLGATSLVDVQASAVESTLTLVRRLDDISLGGTVQFIKIDVEGMEAAVLSGALETIRASQPILYFEARTIETVRDCHAILKAFGYRLHWLLSNPFNRLNFRQEPINIWAAIEFGILAIPCGMRKRCPLPPVTGDELDLPESFDHHAGWDGHISY